MKMLYKVLWVDDNESIVDNTQNIAEDYNLNLVHFTNWETAEKSLRKDFDEYTAIILDAHCKLSNDSLAEEMFIYSVITNLSHIYGEKGNEIPWYLLSAGTMTDFNKVVDFAQREHARHDEEWGKMLYLKDALDDDECSETKLFQTIQSIAPNKSLNTILYRHSDVFNLIGKDKLFYEKEARKDLLIMLKALYFPEENINFVYQGNPLRKILQHIFMVVCDYGLLPDILKRQKGEGESINLTNSSKFLAGIAIPYDENNLIRWGKEKGKDSKSKADSILPAFLSNMVKYILNITQADSHTYVVKQDEKELFFSYVLLICHLIKWFGEFIKQNPEKEKNIKIHNIIPKDNSLQEKISQTSSKIQKLFDNVVKESVGKKFCINKTNGLYVSVSGEYKLDTKFASVPNVITLKNFIINEGPDKNLYPYIITEYE